MDTTQDTTNRAYASCPSYVAVLSEFVTVSGVAQTVSEYLTKLERWFLHRLALRLPSGRLLQHNGPCIRLRRSESLVQSLLCRRPLCTCDRTRCDTFELDSDKQAPVLQMHKELALKQVNVPRRGKSSSDVHYEKQVVHVLKMYVQPKYLRGEHDKTLSDDCVCTEREWWGVCHLTDADTGQVLYSGTLVRCTGHNAVIEPDAKCEHTLRFTLAFREYDEIYRDRVVDDAIHLQCRECGTKRDTAHSLFEPYNDEYQHLAWFKTLFDLGVHVPTKEGWMSLCVA